LVLELRSTTGFGPRRLSRELNDKNGVRLSERTIWKIIRSRSEASETRDDEHRPSMLHAREPEGVLA
jgi:hypothetical protein